MWLRHRQALEALGIAGATLYDRLKAGKIQRRGTHGSYEYWCEVDNTDAHDLAAPSDAWGAELASEYVHDSDRDVYVFLRPPNSRKPVAVDGDTVRALVADYSSDGGGLTVNECARRYAMPRAVVTYLLTALGHTHDALPYTREHIASEDESELVEDLLQRKADAVAIKAQQRHWRAIKRDAHRWQELEREVLDRIERALSSRETPPHYPCAQPDTLDGEPFVCVISANDWHVGQVTTPSEASDGGYNIQIAIRRALSCLAQHMRHVTERYGTPSQWIVPLGDFVHADTWQRTTTRGTQVGGAPMAEQIDASVELAIGIVDALRNAADVLCVPLQGNHDRLSSLWLRHTLRAWFRNVDGVTIADNTRVNHCVQYGASMLHFSHGDEVRKIADLPHRMAVDFAELWGQCRNRYAFVGHRHHTETKDFAGCRVLQAPSLAGRSAWEELEGYRSPHECAAYIIGQSSGHVAQIWASAK